MVEEEGRVLPPWPHRQELGGVEINTLPPFPRHVKFYDISHKTHLKVQM